MTKKLLVIILLIGAIGGIIWGIKNRVTNPAISSKMSVTTSFYPLYFFTSQIGGDKIQVTNITPAGAEPHDYEPSPQDIVLIENSKLLVLLGHLEPWGDKIKSELSGKSTKVIEVGTTLINQTVVEDDKTVIDPHVWLSPLLAQKIVDTIASNLESLDPENLTIYKANAAKLNVQLDQLGQEYKTGLANCQNHDIITSHAAFGYLATAYGLKQIPIAGLSPDAEPSLQQLAQIASFAKTNHIKYIFFESLASPKLSDTIASEVGAQTLVLNPIEGLTPDELAAGHTYLTEMENNLKSLRLALQCQ